MIETRYASFSGSVTLCIDIGGGGDCPPTLPSSLSLPRLMLVWKPSMEEVASCGRLVQVTKSGVSHSFCLFVLSTSETKGSLSSLPDVVRCPISRPSPGIAFLPPKLDTVRRQTTLPRFHRIRSVTVGQKYITFLPITGFNSPSDKEITVECSMPSACFLALHRQARQASMQSPIGAQRLPGGGYIFSGPEAGRRNRLWPNRPCITKVGA